MAEITLESSGKKPISVEITIVYEDGENERRREHDSSIVISARDVQTVVINGNVTGNVKAGNDLACRDIDGDATAGSDMTANDISGDAKAGADLHANDVTGNVTAGADIQCGDVSGNANAGADIDCNYVAGSVTAGGEIASMGFEEDEE